MAWLDRQSFLGPESDETLAAATVGFAGLGGGGSHVAQQLAHVGVGGFVLADDDIVEDTNLNRLIGATRSDVRNRSKKVDVAKRLISGVQPQARIQVAPRKWQDALEPLRSCDLIIGGLDSYLAKSELEKFCRRMLIPYIDMGMDVHHRNHKFIISGQVVLSSPGQPCLWCMGLLNDELLTEEAKLYGAAGGRPQVVWPNGVLASVAVGLAVQMLTPWHPDAKACAYVEYDGNSQTLTESPRLTAVAGTQCKHFSSTEVGDPFFRIDPFLLQLDLETKASKLTGRLRYMLVSMMLRLRGGLAPR